MKYIIDLLILLLSCNVTDESTKCVNELRDKINKQPYSCATALLFGKVLLEEDENPNAVNNPNSAGNQFINLGLLLCLEEQLEDRNCRSKSHTKPGNQKGNLLGY